MLNTFPSFLPVTGILVAIWLPIGVAIAARRYPGYCHRQQFLSELGASGSPTEHFSPIINNYPLALLFTGFAGALIQAPEFLAIGICVFTHGMATALAGLFPMDPISNPGPTSAAHRVHIAAGAVMFLSLFIAQLLGLWQSQWGWVFQSFSLLSAVLSVHFSARIYSALKANKNAGLFQRLGYGTQMVWLATLAYLLVFRSPAP